MSSYRHFSPVANLEAVKIPVGIHESSGMKPRSKLLGLAKLKREDA